MRRRDFITLLGGAAAWPMAAGAQQQPLPVIGYLNPRAANEDPELLDGFRRGLGEAGYVEGRNVAIEYRWADDQLAKLPALVSDLVRRRVDVIAALGGATSIKAAKAQTSSIPIVFVSGGDPVAQGLVASLNRPAGNLTGIAMLSIELIPKKLELLHQLLPDEKVMALLFNPNTTNGGISPRLAAEAARTLGVELHVLKAGADPDIEDAFARLAGLKVGGLLIDNNVFLNARFQQIATRALDSRIPTVFSQREAAIAGGLMSYGDNLTNAYRLAGTFTGRVLKGEKPADLPVQQTTKIEVIINLKTAKALGLTIPPALLARADEVIE